MVFSNNFVVAIKCNGKILREFKDIEQFVKLPFGSEYSILIKNLNSRKSVVSISIDGKDVLDGDRLIIDGNKEVELEGFKKGNKVTNKFKFIEKTEAISDHRGDRIDDSIIRVEYTFEKFVQKKYDEIVTRRKVYYDYHPFWYYEPWTHGTDQWFRTSNWKYLDDGTIYLNNNITYTCSNSLNKPTANCFHATCDLSNDAGITVKGSDNVKQNFVTGHTKELEDTSNVITIKLVGYKESKLNKITIPVTVKVRVECETCGTKNRSKNKFCFNCGTYL